MDVVQFVVWISMGNQRVTWQRITCHACLHASTDYLKLGSPPFEAVAKLRLGNRFSVAKLVTWEVETVLVILIVLS